jgi:hypothetical protein
MWMHVPATRPDVNSRLSATEVAECFDLQHHLRHVQHTLQAAGVQ